jgi:hypothetical protein
LPFIRPRWLQLEPLPPVFTAFATVAFAAGWYKVIHDGVAALVSWLDMIQGVGRGIAIGATMLPCFKDLLSKPLLSGALGDERCAINLMIHATPGLVER